MYISQIIWIRPSYAKKKKIRKDHLVYSHVEPIKGIFYHSAYVQFIFIFVWVVGILFIGYFLSCKFSYFLQILFLLLFMMIQKFWRILLCACESKHFLFDVYILQFFFFGVVVWACATKIFYRPYLFSSVYIYCSCIYR